MQITLYSGFSKRPNSSKQPSTGTVVTATLKDRTSIENPTFLLAAGLSAYENITAVKWDSRYYFVTDVISVHNGLTEIVCNLDRGATFKTQIGNTSAFIERSASGFSDDIRDENVMTTAETFTDEYGGTSCFPSSLGTGVIVVALANVAPTRASGGTAGLAYFDAPGGTYTISNLMRALYANDVISSIEKIFTKPYDAILSVRYIPGFTCTDLMNTGKWDDSTILYFGDYAYTIDYVQPIGTGPWTYSKTFAFDLDTQNHYAAYKWRNFEPYSTWTMFLPFYGTVNIPANEYINTIYPTLLKIKMTVDLTTGELVYSRYRTQTIGQSTEDVLAQEYRTSIGVDVPIQGANRDMLAFTSDIVTGAGSVALMLASGGSAAGAVAAGAGYAARAVVDIAQQNYLTAGSFNAHGTQIATAEQNAIYLTQSGYNTQATPIQYASVLGGPFMKSDLISNHSGYIKCRNASVQMN